MDGRGFFNPYNPYAYPDVYIPGANQFIRTQGRPPVNTPRASSHNAGFNPNSAMNTNASPATYSSNTSTTSNSPESVNEETPQAKRSYDKWTQEEQKLLVSLWSENHEGIESKDAR